MSASALMVRSRFAGIIITPDAVCDSAGEVAEEDVEGEVVEEDVEDEVVEEDVEDDVGNDDLDDGVANALGDA